MNIVLETNHHIASNSLDTLIPWGTRRDNSTNPRFNYKLYKLFNANVLDNQNQDNVFLRILDLGCGGGAFVGSLINNGHIAVGLEGSDWSLKLGRGEWGKIPTLFTCDITRPFQLYENDEPMLFDVVTAWEFLEHIEEKDLDEVFNNIKKHLKEEGLFIATISQRDSIIGGVNLHRTIKPKSWWINKIPLVYQDSYLAYFNGHFLRDVPGSFPVIFSKSKANSRPVPKLSLRERLIDKYHKSNFKRFIKAFLARLIN